MTELITFKAWEIMLLVADGFKPKPDYELEAEMINRLISYVQKSKDETQ